jgi:hypothetical protein
MSGRCVAQMRAKTAAVMATNAAAIVIERLI